MKKQPIHKRAVLSFITLAALLNLISVKASAEEVAPIEISSQKLEGVKKEAESVRAPSPTSNPLQIGVTPLFGMIRSADNNQLLINKYSSGFAAEMRLAPNFSLEGMFRYAVYNVRPDLFIRTTAISQVTQGMPVVGHTDILGLLGIGIINEMTQIMVGGNLKYELYPDSIVTPYVGGGVIHFSNDYSTDSQKGYVKVTLPQSIYGVNAIGGLKLKLSRQFSVLCRGEAGSLLNNRNGSIYYGPVGQESQVYSFHNFRSYDKYISGLVGVTFGL